MSTFVQRWLPISAALVAFACREAPAPGPEPEAQRAALAAAGSSSVDLPSQLANHPAFKRLSERQFQRFGTTLAALAKLPAAEVQAGSQRLETCRSRGPGACAAELRALGIDLPPAQEDEQLALRLAAELGLRDRSHSSLVHLILIATPDGDRAIVPAAFDRGAVPCNAACRDEIEEGLELQGAQAMASMMSSADGDAGDEVAAGAVITIVVTAAVKLIADFFECWWNPDCNVPGEQSPEDIECRNDDDCPEDEYCADGFGDFGPNECRPARPNGESCSDDDQCLTDCCNFNLFGSECANPSKCN